MTPAKTFKEYDRKFKGFQRTDEDESETDRLRASKIQKWDIYVSVFSDREKINHAVYEHETAEEWQKFRVSMKGQSTRMKLLRLRDYLTESFGTVDFEVRSIRVDNYIGALVRGGQLNKKYEVVR